MARTSMVLAALLALGCGGGSTLPRNVRESAHHDYPSCGGHGIRGQVLDTAQGTYAVDACGVSVVYQCPTGAHSRWHRCQRVEPTVGSSIVVQGEIVVQPGVEAQPAAAPADPQEGTATPTQEAPAPQ